MKRTLGMATAALMLFGDPAQANDLFGGVYSHDQPVFTHGIGEGGADFEVGYRWHLLFLTGPFRGLQPYLLGSVNTRGDSDFAAAGLSWKLGTRLYFRPGLGLAVHDGPHRRYDRLGYRTDLGSRVLFEPELALGVRVAPRLALEASWTHLSHAGLFSDQNPGEDNLGLRVNFAF